MSRADRIAVWVKAAKNEYATCVIAGNAEADIIAHNPDPCDPPDYDTVKGTFCGLHLIRSCAVTGVSIGIRIHA